jgi:hypothetical protein
VSIDMLLSDAGADIEVCFSGAELTSRLPNAEAVCPTMFPVSPESKQEFIQGRSVQSPQFVKFVLHVLEVGLIMSPVQSTGLRYRRHQIWDQADRQVLGRLPGS